MSERLTVLFISHPTWPAMWQLWGEKVKDILSDRHNFYRYDHSRPLAPQFKDVDVVVDLGGRAIDREAMARAATGTVRLWQILGSGFEHFPLEDWRTTGIPVANCPGPFSAVALAECAMMFILMLTRRYPVAQKHLKEGIMSELLGTELTGLKLGIVGFGASGRELARRALPFGMRILALVGSRDVGQDERETFNLEFVGKAGDLDQLIVEADVVSLHLHLNQETHHIIDARRLELMKPTAFLINVARGQLVDETALIGALQEGRIAGAGLDVFSQEPPDPDSPLFSLPNVVTTPHIAGVTDGTALKRAQAVAQNVERIAAGQEPLYRIDT